MTTGSFAAGLLGVVLDGRYRLDALLGEGGMGSVFRAQHLAMDRKVAVKLLKPHLTQDETAAQRFLREARATLKVESAHAVKVLDFGVTPHGDYYMALEYLDGRTVQRELEIDGPFAPARVLHIARQALDALAAAHRSGLVHRDIKPENILLLKVGGDADYTKLLDFGVAKLMEGAAHDPENLALTQAGMVFGTPEFMSPEQAMGQPLDGRSDLYSLAATMFAMLTGCALFEGRTPIELLTHHVRTPPPHLEMLVPELAQLPQLDAMLQRALAKDKAGRPASAAAFALEIAALERELRGDAPARPSPSTSLSKAPSSSASSYVLALPAAVRLAASGAADVVEHASHESPLEDSALDLPAVARWRRGPLVAAAAVALLGVAIAVAMGARSSRAPVAPPDHAPVVASAPADAAPALDAADVPVVVAADRPKPRPTDARAPRSEVKVDAHLVAAEQALRAGNQLRQLAEADLALRADPRSVRARYLLADALIKSGDLDRGCSNLKALGRHPPAIARAAAAGCPK